MNVQVGRIFRQSLALSLALSLSGVLPTLRSARADLAHDGALARAKASDRAAQALEQKLMLEIRRARSAGTAGRSNPFTLDTISREFERWRADLEEVLTIPDESVDPGGDALPFEAKLRAINTYLNQASLYALLEIVRPRPHDSPRGIKGGYCSERMMHVGPAWIEAHALTVPRSVADQLSGFGSRNRMGDPYFSMIADYGPDGKADKVRLKLSAGLVQGLELKPLSDQLSEDGHLTMIKYLATRQLLASLRELKYLKRDRDVTIPPMPSGLTSKLRSFCMASLIDDERDQAVDEQVLRMTLMASFNEYAAGFEPFHDPELLDAMVTALDPRDRRTATLLLQEHMSLAEEDYLTQALQGEIPSYSAPLGKLSAEAVIQSLAEILSNAKAGAYLTKFVEFRSKFATLRAFTDPSLSQLQQVADLIDARVATYRRALQQTRQADLLARWHYSALAAGDGMLYANQRTRFIETLLYNAPAAAQQMDRAYAGDSVDPELLEKAFEQEIEALPASSNLQDWKHDIRSAGSYLAARDAYNRIVSDRISPEALVGGVVDPHKARYLLSSRDFRDPISFAHTDPARARRIVESMANGTLGELDSLLSYGTWMGFHKVYMGPKPSVREVIGDKRRESRYFEALDESTLSSFPVLGTTVQLTNSRGVRGEAKLAEALAAMNPRHESAERLMSRAVPLIDQSIEIIHKKVLEDIETVSRATSPADIGQVVESNMMISLVLRGFPEFRSYNQHVIEKVLSPSVVDQVVHNYVTPSMKYGMGTLMLIQGVNWTAKLLVKRAFPFTNLFLSLVETPLQGLTHGVIALLVADGLYEANHLRKEYYGSEQVEDFFFCSVRGACITDFVGLKKANARFASTAIDFGVRMVLDTAMMYFPMAKGIYNHVGDRLLFKEFEAHVRLFSELRAEPGDFASVEARAKIAEHLREGRAIGPEMVEPRPDGSEGWTQVRRGKAIYDGVAYDIGGGNGAIRTRDLEIFLGYRNTVPRLTPEQWAGFRSSAAKLLEAIRAGRHYRLQTVVERMAIEDAFKALHLNPTKPASWSRIEEARSLHARAASSPELELKVNRAARYLESLRAEVPQIAQTEFVPASRAERKLIDAFKRSPRMEVYWNIVAAEIEHGGLGSLTGVAPGQSVGASPGSGP